MAYNPFAWPQLRGPVARLVLAVVLCMLLCDWSAAVLATLLFGLFLASPSGTFPRPFPFDIPSSISMSVAPPAWGAGFRATSEPNSCSYVPEHVTRKSMFLERRREHPKEREALLKVPRFSRCALNVFKNSTRSKTTVRPPPKLAPRQLDIVRSTAAACHNADGAPLGAGLGRRRAPRWGSTSPRSA